MQHPADHEGTTTGNNIGNSALLLETGDSRPGHTAVHGNEIDAVPRVIFNDGKDIVNGHFHDGTVPLNSLNTRLINRHRADRPRTHGDNSPPYSRNIAAGAQVHDGIRSGLDSRAQLFQLGINVAEIGGSPDIGIDLGGQSLSNPAGFEVSMPDISRNNHCPFVHALTDKLGVQAFRLRERPVWGVQFNPQYDPVIAEGVIRAASSLEKNGYDVDEMVATGYREYDDLAGRVFGNFLRYVADAPVLGG